MKRSALISALLLGALPLGADAGIIINPHPYSAIAYGNSWDQPPVHVEQVLSALGITDDFHLTLINGFAGETESWFANGAFSIIVEEIAGYAGATTFGWYETGNASNSGQLFSGSDTDGAIASVVFDPAIEFGFYIDPNGVSNNRLFTEHLLNPGSHHQTTIFSIDELPDLFILGWEDLTLTGSTDKDYQDMIVLLRIQSVPEPGALLLMLLGLAGLLGRNMRGAQRLSRGKTI